MWQNRIAGQGIKPADQFQAHPDNWRTHPKAQQKALTAILNEVGWVDTVIENVRTGNLIDGHERVWQALEHNAEVPYIQVDLSPEEEALILATLDPIGAMAGRDQDKLKAVAAQAKPVSQEALETLQNIVNSVKGVGQPEDFSGNEKDDKETECCCPKCGYRWIG